MHPYHHDARHGLQVRNNINRGVLQFSSDAKFWACPVEVNSVDDGQNDEFSH